MNEDERQSAPLPPEAVDALRAHLRVPDEDAYWHSLHAGIMARVAEAGGQAWWMVLSRWARPALAAAAVILVIASAAMVFVDASRAPVAYVDVLDAQPVVPVRTAQSATPRSAREATFHFVMSSNGGRAP